MDFSRGDNGISGKDALLLLKEITCHVILMRYNYLKMSQFNQKSSIMHQFNLIHIIIWIRGQKSNIDFKHHDLIMIMLPKKLLSGTDFHFTKKVFQGD